MCIAYLFFKSLWSHLWWSCTSALIFCLIMALCYRHLVGSLFIMPTCIWDFLFTPLVLVTFERCCIYVLLYIIWHISRYTFIAIDVIICIGYMYRFLWLCHGVKWHVMYSSFNYDISPYRLSFVLAQFCINFVEMCVTKQSGDNIFPQCVPHVWEHTWEVVQPNVLCLPTDNVVQGLELWTSMLLSFW